MFRKKKNCLEIVCIQHYVGCGLANAEYKVEVYNGLIDRIKINITVISLVQVQKILGSSDFKFILVQI